MTTTAATLPDDANLDAMAELISALGIHDRHVSIAPEWVEVRTDRHRLVLYWDRQDPANTGWAWALHTGRDDDGSYGADDVCSGALDSVDELDELRQLCAADAHVLAD